jgi:hypothetical protein
VTQGLDGDGSDARADEHTGGDLWAPAERQLLNAALDFYGAADGVIDFAGLERPQLRQDAAGFEAVRRAMAALEESVRAAQSAGVTPERIAEIARIDPEMVTLILERRDAAPSRADG